MRKFHEDGFLTATNEQLELVPLKYHYFFNSFDTFVFMFPKGDKQFSDKNFHEIIQQHTIAVTHN
jgi:hypothetical protein